ncbi:MrpF/PhaF family protein [Actinocrispum sp. NPDC049592]|uniref:MrpF/PhaF family protein n=1 Tax=Actinocrispum sp. NPDC049592 TaxID=3154835 RepID=UPI00343918AB
MNGWEVAAFVLVIGGIVPALILACRGDAVHRLVGLELASSVGVLVMLVMIQATGQPSYLIVPLVLALLGFAGTLVFTRLLGSKP